MLLPTLKTDRLRIRPLRVKDLSSCHQLYLDTKWADRGLADKRNLQIRRIWLDWTIRNYTELDWLNQPPYGDRAVELRESGQVARPDHVLFATDWPYATEAIAEMFTSMYEGFSLSESQRAAIDRSNAEALFPRLRGGLS